MARKSTTKRSTEVRRNKVFVDTGGWYAVISTDDRKHESAVLYYKETLNSGALIFTSDYVLDETLTRLRYDFGHAIATAFWKQIAISEQSGRLTILSVDSAVWAGALDIFLQYGDQDFSFTDCTSFELARRESCETAFTFDHHFRLFGLATRPEE